MQLHALIFAGMIGLGAIVAIRAASSAPEAAPPERVVKGEVPPARVVVPEMPPTGAIDADEDDGEAAVDVAELIATAEHHVAEARRERNAIVGHVVDAATSEAIAGVTVIVTGPALTGAQSAISDERGDYAVTDLPAGSYLVTWYLGNLTVERDGVQVSALEPTRLVQKLDSRSAWLSPHPNVPVPGGQFNVKLGTADQIELDWESSRDRPEQIIDRPADEPTVSFSGVTTLENDYIIDGM